MALGAVLLLAARAAISRLGFTKHHQMEVGAGLELKANGHFRYRLVLRRGVDEEAEGDWIFRRQTVRLTTRSRCPRSPAFELVRDDPAPKGELVR